jgi:hypothetical protein
VNFDRIKKSVGTRLQLLPPAILLDDVGRNRGTYDNVWILDAVEDNDVRISTSTGHFTLLGKDHVHHYTSNPNESRQAGVEHGFFTLNVQIYIQGNKVKILPLARPGEPNQTAPETIEEMLVDFRFPQDSGLQARLEAGGYKVAWAGESRLARLVNLEGYVVVVERMANGGLTSFRLKDRPEDKILVKRASVAT